MSRLSGRDLGVLPGLRDALVWLLQEYPDKRDGLSRLQRNLLRELSRLGRARIAVIVASMLRSDSVGDVFLLDLLRRCIEVEHPLVNVESIAKGVRKKRLTFASWVVLTEFGRSVLRRRADHILLNGIDRWIGGVHLVGHRVPWRWDAPQNRIVSTPGLG